VHVDSIGQVTYVKGFGKLNSASEVAVDLSAGGSQVLKAKNVVIATGSEPSTIPNVTVCFARVRDSHGYVCILFGEGGRGRGVLHAR